MVKPTHAIEHTRRIIGTCSNQAMNRGIFTRVVVTPNRQNVIEKGRLCVGGTFGFIHGSALKCQSAHRSIG